MKQSGGLAIAGIVIVAVILGVIFFARRGGAFGDGLGFGDGGGGAMPVTIESPGTGIGASDAGYAPASTPSAPASGSIMSPSYGYSDVAGKSYVTRSSQGFGAPGISPSAHVPAEAAFGFGGDASGSGLRVNPVFHQPDFVVERRAGLRNEAIGMAPQPGTTPSGAAQDRARGAGSIAKKRMEAA